MTSGERFEQLADLVLDGAATSEERAELARILAADPAARQQYSEIESFFTDLRSMPRREPPADLLPATLAVIGAVSPARAPVPPRTGWIEADVLMKWGAWLRPRPALRYGAVFAAGLAASALFLTGIRVGVPENDPTAGSMMPGPGTTPLELAIPAGTVEATLQSHDGAWTVSIESDLASPASLTIEHDLALRSIEPPAGASGALAPGMISFTLGGRTSTRIALGPTGASTPVRLVLHAGPDSARGTLDIHSNSGSDPQVVR